ncbi:5-oxoprolinase subunit C family protein [Marixanthomonas ophiurae]|uniref:Biotin-dependent carboxyltransferase family protein n=1 Tax=Marixanthomonas ophiurae TaxID=387659 RepID=A0A3E1Q6Z1_9FLAO|nr:biotin-dependent carboxyltransferase family protein [Marixanthomonas ophiurae]RFN57905.1 biotin-dependent carboxyltransferase family protein [Marixanthomonas ophiurae]
MVEVLKSGLFTTIQDKGRTGYRRLGVPVSGAMDTVSAAMANKLLDNSTQAAVMEFTMMGPRLQFKSPTIIAICGAGFHARINDVRIELDKATEISENDVLKIDHPDYGNYGYLAVLGGFEVEMVLGSRSFYNNITKKKRLEKGDVLKFSTTSTEKIVRHASFSIDEHHFNDDAIEVYPGPEFDLLPKKFQKKIMDTTLKVASQSNRMAYVVEGLEDLSVKEIITAPVQPGTVQLTPSGKCVVLMRDAQTTGGYARILQLSEQAICKLAQKRVGESVHFKLIEFL